MLAWPSQEFFWLFHGLLVNSCHRQMHSQENTMRGGQINILDLHNVKVRYLISYFLFLGLPNPSSFFIPFSDHLAYHIIAELNREDAKETWTSKVF